MIWILIGFTVLAAMCAVSYLSGFFGALAWDVVAWVLSRPLVADALIAYAQRTPYSHLPSNDDPSYMGRWWVFNPYAPTVVDGVRRYNTKYRWCPWSIRVHHIKRRDDDRHLHDHPWNARTIILRGGYCEIRPMESTVNMLVLAKPSGRVFWRKPGDTATLGFRQFHRIASVCEDGAWTLFMSGPFLGDWGFDVDGLFVPHGVYLGEGPQ